MRLGIIGAGNLGKAIIRNASKNCEIIAVKRNFEEIKGAKVTCNLEDIASCDIIVVTLKPNVFREKLKEIGEVSGNKPVISFVAGVKLDEMMKYIKKPFRAMTNLAIESGGFVAYFPPETKDYLTFLNATKIECESESELELATAFIGSSPALVAYLMHAFILSGVKAGLKYSKAKMYAEIAFRSAVNLYTKYTLDELVEKIATPGGTTIEGIAKIVEVQKPIIDSLVATSAKAFKI